MRCATRTHENSFPNEKNVWNINEKGVFTKYSDFIDEEI